LKPLAIVGISAIVIIIIIIGIGTLVGTQPEQPQVTKKEPILEQPTQTQEPTSTKSTFSDNLSPTISPTNCVGTAECFTDYITRIVDGDTIHTADKKIRLSLTNAPETYEDGYNEATEFTKMLCPVGSKILVDQDDLQLKDEYGRILAKVYCGDKLLNSELLYNGHARILTLYCSKSEFSGEDWAIRYGCESSRIQPTTIPSPNVHANTQPTSCDPSYPDFCIPSPPPDLDCKDIVQKKFTVIGSDPHGFDGDGDGIGCES
jgi:endonuclease YncB( thermonuclease family)